MISLIRAAATLRRTFFLDAIVYVGWGCEVWSVDSVRLAEIRSFGDDEG